MATNSTLQAIRARLAQAEQNKSKQFDNVFYPFWNAKQDSTSVLRFLPDGDQNNTYFWVEKQLIKLPFNGIKGGETKPVTVSVPCVEMFGKTEYPQGCPILSEVRLWYKDESLKEKANRYWKKPQYIMQGFVRENAVSDDNPPKNPIRKFMMNKQIFNLVKAGLMDVDMINLPCDYLNGTDFKIVKTTKGQYADYGTSSYARRESALSQTEMAAIQEFGLSNLSELLGKKPTADELKIIREMFEASVDGEAYDAAKWGNYFKPSGFKSEGSDSNHEEKSEPETKTEATKSETKAPVTEATQAPTQNKSAADILEMIKSRGKKAEAKA